MDLMQRPTHEGDCEMKTLPLGKILFFSLMISIPSFAACSQTDPIIDATSSAQYSFVSGYGKCLDVQDGQGDKLLVSNTCELGKKSQLWNKDVPYKHSSGKCLGVKNGARNATLVECREDEEPQWSLRDETLIHLRTSECMDVSRSSTEDGTNVIIWRCTGNKNQSWQLMSNADVGVSSKPILRLGESLAPGQFIEQSTADATYRAVMEHDCNFVFYGFENSIVWQSGTGRLGNNCSVVLEATETETTLEIINNDTKHSLWALKLSGAVSKDVVLEIDPARKSLHFGELGGRPETAHYTLSSMGTQAIPKAKIIDSQSVKFTCHAEGETGEDVAAFNVEWFAVGGFSVGSIRKDVSDSCEGEKLEFNLLGAADADVLTLTVEGGSRYILNDFELYKNNKFIHLSPRVRGREYCFIETSEIDQPSEARNCRALLMLQY